MAIQLTQIEYEELYTLEYSRYSEQNKMSPWHIDTLDRTLKKNMEDCITGRTGKNVWMVIMVGTHQQCKDALYAMERIKKNANNGVQPTRPAAPIEQ